MTCQVVNSQAQVQSRLPSLPQTLPQTQADWNSFLSTLSQWAAILQQESHAPNVIPSQFQTFTASAANAVIAALSAANTTPSVDAGTQYYGAASLKVAIGAANGTLGFSGISISAASRWFCAFQIYAPNGCTGSLTVKTANATVTESFTVPASVSWQRVWGLFDLRKFADTQASWQFTFTSTQTVWIDGMQMNAVGSPIGTLPKFAGTQMVTGLLAYQSNLDGVPDGTTYARPLSGYLASGVPYTFKGVWLSTTAYVKGDEVVYGDSYWVALANSSNSAPATSNANWQVVGTYSGFLGAWSSTTAYAPGAEVTYSGNFWVCVSANTNSAPSTSNANWQIAGPANLDNVADGSTYARTLAAYLASGRPFNYLGAYSGATTYHIGDEVSYSGNYYLAIGNPIAGTAPTNATYWKLLGPTSVDAVPDGATYVRLLAANSSGNVAYNFKGVWSSATAYVIGDEVVYGQNYWIAIAASTNSAPASGNSNWQVIGSYSAFLGAWSSVTAYAIGSEVTYSGNFWVAVNASTNSAPSTSNANWQIAGPTSLDSVADGSTYVRILASHAVGNVSYNFKGQWSSVSSYVQGDEVFYGATYWVALAANTNSAPSTSNANWQASGTYSQLLGPWNSATAYVQGAEVTYSGNYWIALAASTNSAPAIGNANWQLAGPLSLDNVADGSTYVRLLASHAIAGVAYNFKGAWSSATTYVKGDEVFYGASYWVAQVGNANSAPTTANANWQIVGSYSQFLGAWNSSTAYAQGAEITYGGNYWVAVAANTNSAPSLSNANWQIAGPVSLDDVADGSTYVRLLASHAVGGVAYNFKGAWSSTAAYVQGDEVFYGASYWVAQAGNTNSSPSTGNANWQVVGTYSQFLGAWSSTTAYSQGSEVTSGGNYWVAVAANTNSAPSTSNANWQIAGPTNIDDVADGSTYARTLGGYLVNGVPYNFRGAWGSGTAYNKGDEVSYSGNYYLCILANTGNAPANATYWQLLGPTTLDVLPDGSTYQRGQRYNFGNNTATAAWVHLGTLVLTQASSATFVWHTGKGHNTGQGQQTILTWTIRASDNVVAPNLAGMTAFVQGGTNPIYPEPTPPYSLVAVATGNSISVTNTSWELYAALQNFTLGPIEAIINTAAGDSFTFSGAAGTYSGYPSTPPANTWVGTAPAWQSDATGRINTINGAIAPYGSIPPGTAGGSGFSYTSATTSITWSWTAMTVYRSDGTTSSVSSGSQTITGLVASTTYTFYPYIDENTLAVGFSASGSNSTGSPAIAYTASSADGAAVAYEDAHFPLLSMTAATPASGSGGGGGPPLCCLNGAQLIELANGKQIPARELTIDHYLTCPGGPVAVRHVQIEHWGEWFRVTLSNGVTLFVAGDHRFIDPSNVQICARDIRLQQIVQAVGEYVYVTKLEFIEEVGEKVSIEVASPHTYYVQGILSHNKIRC